MTFDEYYIHRKGDFVGNAPVWWAKGGKGYTSYILGAERFSKEDADALISRSGGKYKAYLCADVDARLHLVYDVQDDKRLGTDAPCGWPCGYASIASMQGEAVAEVIFTSIKKPDVEWLVNSVTKGTKLFTYPPDAAARIAELEDKLAEVMKDAERYIWLCDHCVDFEEILEGDSYTVKSLHFEYSPKLYLHEAIDAAIQESKKGVE